ncbi:Heterokaryon incompatibility protein (HET) domain containing protein [Rhypophila sp. PSN 637]
MPFFSHTWGEDGDEITYNDILNLDSSVESKPGFFKIRFCAEQAAGDGSEYFWVDTCCINKSDSTELSEAINSMFSWYAKAVHCYVYLSDVGYEEICEYKKVEPDGYTESMGLAQLRRSRWFTRGWTVQELLAPRDVRFFSSDGAFVFSKTDDFRIIIHELTGIPIPALQGKVPLASFTVEERFSWAVARQTTRPEDTAYCLLGIFDVFILLIYDEGRKNALYRLRRAVEEKEYQRALVAFTPKQAPIAPTPAFNNSRGGLMEAFVGGVGGSIATIGIFLSGKKLTRRSQQTESLSETALTDSPTSPLPSLPPHVAPQTIEDTLAQSQINPKPKGPQNGRIVNINSYKLLKEDLLEVLTELFPQIPRDEMEIDNKHRNYRLWPPRDLTEEEHQQIMKKRKMTSEQMASGILSSISLASHCEG